MDLVDLIVGIVVVTILVTVVVGLATYVAYKFRLARQPSRSDGDDDGTRYFFLHEPPEEESDAGPGAEPADASGRSSSGEQSEDRADVEADGGDAPAGDGR